MELPPFFPQRKKLMERADTLLSKVAAPIQRFQNKVQSVVQKVIPAPASREEAVKQGMVPVGSRYVDVTGSIGSAGRKAIKTATTNLVSDAKPLVNNTISRLIQSVKEAEPIRKQAGKLYTAELAKRAAVGSKALQAQGEKGYFKALGALKGELPKPTFQSPRNKFGQEEIDELFDTIKQRDDLDFFDKINASKGLAKIVNRTAGAIPTTSELKLLQKVYGPELVDAVRSKRPTWDKVAEGVAEVINVPRALMASMDMSAPLRQGRVLISAYPKKGAEAFKDMFMFFGSEETFKAAMDDIAKRPTAPLMKQSKLSLTDITDDAIGLTEKEESFMTNLAAKIPVAGRLVKASERAYVGFLNKMRADVFDDLANEYMKGGITPEDRPEVFSNLADFINTATGRGNLGKFANAAPILNGVFFSPRFMASRMQMLNPVWYLKQPPEVRREAAKSMVKFVGSGVAVLGLAKLGGADVEIDPRSTDFGKIRFGNTRYDMWGGFQQWVRLIAQLSTGEVKSSTSGKVRELSKKEFPYTSRLDQTFNFFVGKFAPVPALVADILRGQNLVGEELDWKEETYEKLIPLYTVDIAEAVKQQGPSAVATVGIPAFFGVSTQTYEATKQKSQLPAIPSLGGGGLPALPKLNP
jgi:hypothetical protein